MKLWQKRITSASDLPCGSKSAPPLPPPIGRPVREFFRICSIPRNFRMDWFTDGWKRRPPLYGPMAELNCTLYPRFTWFTPLSSVHGTLNVTILSGSTNLSRRAFLRYTSSFFETIGSRDSRILFAASRNSGSCGCFAFNPS